MLDIKALKIALEQLEQEITILKAEKAVLMQVMGNK